MKKKKLKFCVLEGARETPRDQAAIGFNFDVDWLRERRRFSDNLPKGV